jgi:hypothetical protein
MIGALLYLRLTSLRNFVIYRIQRLRQPKYLVGTAVAAAYIYFILLRRTAPGGRAIGPPGMAGAGLVGMAVICVGLAAIGLLRLAFVWISPAEKPGLRFTEAEIAFLFPAPVTRKTLIHFRLLSAQFAILFTSCLMALFFNRFGSVGGSRVLRAIAWWVILSLFDLHVIGTHLALARLRERGKGYVLWRSAGLAAIVAYVVAIVASAAAFARGFPAGDLFAGLAEGKGFVPALMHSQPFGWLILPFRIVFGPYFATGIRDFGLAMVPALLLLGIHYYWVSSSQVSFEEGSIALAEKRAAAKAAALAGDFSKLGSSKPKARSGPFPLSPTGPVEIAFLWKNLLSMRSSLLNRRTMLISAWIVFCLCLGLRPLLTHQARGGGFEVFAPVLVMFCGIIAAYTILLGPQIVRQDLRGDLANADILKTYPIEGWRLAFGELLAPTAVLTLSLWLTILVCAAALDPRGSIEWLTPGVRWTAAFCAGLVAPFVCLIQLIVPNSIMLLLPGWYQATRTRGGGIELFGQRLIFGFAQLLMALVVAVPAVVAAGLIIFSAHYYVNLPASIAVATLAVVTIFAGEAALGLWWLGARFERFDLSAEIR